MSYGLLPYVTCLSKSGQSPAFALWSSLNLQMEHCMHSRVLHLIPDLGTDSVDLLLRVSQLASEEGVGKSFKALGNLQIIPCANFFLIMRGHVSCWNYYHVMENLTKCLSAGQVPTGQTNFSALISLKPASFIQPSRSGPGQGSILAALDALMNTWLNLRDADSGLREPSGDVQARSRSIHSTHPPDLVLLSMV